ncbi:MAG: MarR family winged helix-turn-helix transcriptional regulator [Bacteroidales bacterium]
MEKEQSRSLILAILQTQSTFRTVVQRSLGQLDKNITFEMIQVLVELWKQDGINQQELANKTFKDKSSLSYLLNNLEKRDLVLRYEDEHDRRNKLILLTDKGRELQNHFSPILGEIYAQMAEKLDPDTLDFVISYMKELNLIISKINLK